MFYGIKIVSLLRYLGQNSVLKLAYAHVRIMITRLFVLENFAALGQFNGLDDNNFVAQRHLNDCLAATYTILDTGIISSSNIINRADPLI